MRSFSATATVRYWKVPYSDVPRLREIHSEEDLSRNRLIVLLVGWIKQTQLAAPYTVVALTVLAGSLFTLVFSVLTLPCSYLIAGVVSPSPPFSAASIESGHLKHYAFPSAACRSHS